MAQDKGTALGFIVRDVKEENNDNGTAFAGIRTVDNIPSESYAEMSFGTVAGTVVPRTEETGRIKGTYSVYGRINAGQSITKSTAKPFVPEALIRHMEETEQRLKLVDMGHVREKKATEDGTALVVKKQAQEKEDSVIPKNMLKVMPIKDDKEEEEIGPQLGTVDVAEETPISFPKNLVQSTIGANLKKATVKETQTVTLKGPFGQIKLAVLNVYFKDPMVILRFGLDRGFSYTPPSGPVLLMEDTYPIVFTGIEFDMEDIDAHIQLYVLAENK